MAEILSTEQNLEILKESGALLSGHFKLTSGRHSDRYMQCAQLFKNPDASRKMCAQLAQKLKGIEIDLVVSPAVGGIIMGYEMACQLGTPNIFAERQDKKMTLRRGFHIPKGANVLVVEDAVTTGGSVREVIALIEEAGANLAAVAIIVDRTNGKIDFGAPLFAAVSLEVESYEADDCKLCKQGIPINAPGSRNLK